MKPFVVVMGVSGCGKTTIAKALAEALGGSYLEGDSFHTSEAKSKMGSGIPLADEDRWPWFDQIIRAAHVELSSGRISVLSCSALKESYRHYLFHSFEDPRLIYLQGSFELIKSRMDARNHEYMTSDLLRSQFDTIEEPKNAPNVLRLSIQSTPGALIRSVCDWL
jgi:gluconokinase